MYGGIKILHKHAHYLEFQRIASEEEKQYFVFAGLRNPLDEAVTKYFKFKVNHKNKYTSPDRLMKNGGNVTAGNIKKFNFIRENGADFPAFLKKFYRLPYSNIVSVSYEYCDFLIRFEHLADDFAKALELIGLEQKRPLPRRNKTNQRSQDYQSYYTPEIRPLAKRIFGPFMKKWNYDFPPEWGADRIPWPSQLSFYVIDFLKNINWKYVRWSPYFYGQLFRRFR
jgi:hypothetical protein